MAQLAENATEHLQAVGGDEGQIFDSSGDLSVRIITEEVHKCL